MSGRHQPENGADSTEALASIKPAERLPGTTDQEWTEFMEWDRAVAAHYGVVIECAACSLPALTDGYCAGHARLGEYRVTDSEHWASND